MPTSSLERVITFAASIITLWSVWSAAPLGGSGTVLIFDGFTFGPRLVAVFVTDALVIWIFSRLVFFSMTIKQSHTAFVLTIAVFAANSWQSVYLFHYVLFQKLDLATLEFWTFIVLESCSATMFGLLLHSHYQTYSKRFRSPFHVPRNQARIFDLFVLGRMGIVGISLLSYIPFALWVLIDPETFYR